MQVGKYLFVGLSIVSILLILVLFIYPILKTFWGILKAPASLPDNIEIVVPESEKPGNWLLSPNGDKIVFGSFKDTRMAFMLFTETKQKHNLGDCTNYTWVDNMTLYCYDRSSIIVANNEVDSLAAISLKKVKATDIDLASLLQRAGAIYGFECSNLSSNLWLRDVVSSSGDSQNYLVEGIESITEILQAYRFDTVSCIKPVGGPVEKVHSPDSRYYFNVVLTANNQAALTVYEATSDKEVAEFVTNELESIILGGWAADNSGVYFQVVSNARFFQDRTNTNKILKLKVSE